MFSFHKATPGLQVGVYGSTKRTKITAQAFMNTADDADAAPHPVAQICGDYVTWHF